jgi:UDP-3-O-[3-hydroxymyristoyl] glucosamine N-acyltransferase
MSIFPGVAAPVRLADIVQELGGELVGEGDLTIQRIASLESADEHSITFLAQAKLRDQLKRTRAGCIIVRADLRDEAAARGTVIVSPDPHVYFARLTRWWVAHQHPAAVAGVHRSAVVGEGVKIHPTASVGALAVIEDGVTLGEGVVVGAHSFVGAHAQIGAFTRLGVHVTFGEGCIIGSRGKLQNAAVIGSDGFGFAHSAQGWEKIEQLGIVRIGDDVDIGSNTCVDRGALDDTVLGNDVKLDNLIQIAHNVHIGDHTAMAGCVGVAGSAHIGARCTFGGAAMISGHLKIVDDVFVTAGSLVMNSILKPGQYTGFFPIDENANWEKNAATLRQLHTLRSRLRALEKKLTA